MSKFQHREPRMTQTSLWRLEVTTWFLGIYLVLCIISHPPMTRVEQIVNLTVVPRVLISETREPAPFPRDLTFFIPLGLDWVGIRTGRGSLASYHQYFREIDPRRTIAWLAGTAGLTGITILLLRRHSKRFAQTAPGGFEIQPPNAPPAPLP